MEFVETVVGGVVLISWVILGPRRLTRDDSFPKRDFNGRPIRFLTLWINYLFISHNWWVINMNWSPVLRAWSMGPHPILILHLIQVYFELIPLQIFSAWIQLVDQLARMWCRNLDPMKFFVLFWMIRKT